MTKEFLVYIWNNFLPAIFFGFISIVAFLSVFGIGCLILYSLYLINKVIKIYLEENIIDITQGRNPKKTILNKFLLRYAILFIYLLIILELMNVTKGLSSIFLLFFNHKLKKILDNIE